MTSEAVSWEQQTERRFIESLRARYEGEGFAFTVEPEAAKLPDFLRSYRPDALAQKAGHNVAIEVKRRPGPSTDRALKDIRRLFEGHPDWQLHVVFMGTDQLQSITIRAAEPARIRSLVSEVRRLIAVGHSRAAFVMAWSLLEAALRSREGETTSRPRTVGTVVQTLAMNGYIGPDVERRMRDMIDLRNRIVHGDVAAEPAIADVEIILSAVEETLSADAS